MVGTILSTSYSRELYENSVKMTTKAALYRHAWKHACSKKSNCQLHLYQNCIGNSSALQNAAEFKELLLQQYEDKENIPPILIIYTYWDPEPDIAD